MVSQVLGCTTKFLGETRVNCGGLPRTYDGHISGALGSTYREEFALNFESISLEVVCASVGATMYQPSTGAPVSIPFVPGAVRIFDGTLRFVENLVLLIGHDVGSGAIRLCQCKFKRICNVPARLTLLIRNLFHVMAGVCHLMPFLGCALAHLVYLVNITVEELFGAIICVNLTALGEIRIYTMKDVAVTYSQSAT